MDWNKTTDETPPEGLLLCWYDLIQKPVIIQHINNAFKERDAHDCGKTHHYEYTTPDYWILIFPPADTKIPEPEQPEQMPPPIQKNSWKPHWWTEIET